MAILWWLRHSGQNKPTYYKNLLFHWLLFAWIGSYAFAYMGETP